MSAGTTVRTDYGRMIEVFDDGDTYGPGAGLDSMRADVILQIRSAVRSGAEEALLTPREAREVAHALLSHAARVEEQNESEAE